MLKIIKIKKISIIPYIKCIFAHVCRSRYSCYFCVGVKWFCLNLMIWSRLVGPFKICESSSTNLYIALYGLLDTDLHQGKKCRIKVIGHKAILTAKLVCEEMENKVNTSRRFLRLTVTANTIWLFILTRVEDIRLVSSRDLFY